MVLRAGYELQAADMDVGKTRKIREGHRQAARKLIHNANEAIDIMHGAETLSHEDIVKLRLNKNLLTENDKTLEEFNSKILVALKKAEDIEEEALGALEFRQELQRVLVKIELLLERDNAARLQSQMTAPSPGETSSGTTKVSCKLPKLSLQTFGGDPAQWSLFWDTFETP